MILPTKRVIQWRAKKLYRQNNNVLCQKVKGFAVAQLCRLNNHTHSHGQNNFPNKFCSKVWRESTWNRTRAPWKWVGGVEKANRLAKGLEQQVDDKHILSPHPVCTHFPTWCFIYNLLARARPEMNKIMSLSPPLARFCWQTSVIIFASSSRYIILI